MVVDPKVREIAMEGYARGGLAQDDVVKPEVMLPSAYLARFGQLFADLAGPEVVTRAWCQLLAGLSCTWMESWPDRPDDKAVGTVPRIS